MDWLNHVELYFNKNSNNNTTQFKKNRASFEEFYKQYKQYEQNGNSTKALCKSEIKATLVLADMDEDLLDEILKWDGKICLSQKFSSPLDLLQCTNYKVNNYIYFVINKGTTYNNKSILYYVYFK